ncbi:MAG: hypothetical protein GOV00_01540 [Candidatus Altiarchaeota archaeon]|nr:hypothetical protein [Candidatus Altiarchaeota archaeon]
MEKASFTVDTSDWRVFYKMNYNGNQDGLIAFTSLVSGTCGLGALRLRPAAMEAAKEVAKEFEDIAERLSKMKRATSKHLKRKEVPKNKYLELFVLQQALQILGAKTCLEKKELKKTLKDI